MMQQFSAIPFGFMQNLPKNETLYLLVHTRCVYQGLRSFSCPENFGRVLNERVLIVAEA